MTPQKGDERRKDYDTRRMVEAGAREALRQFVAEYSPHDVETHEGRMAFRADLYYANKLRRLCENAKSTVMKSAIGTAITAVVAGGIAWFAHWGPK